MWLRWVMVVLAFGLVVGIMVIFVTGDSECRNWQQGYTVVYEEFAERNEPVIERQVVVETESRIGPRPQDCELPKLLNE